MRVTAQTTTIPEAFQATARAHAGEPALRAHGGAISWSWGDYYDRVRACAAGLAALGGKRGDTLACWLTNRPEFHAVDIAAAHLGMASVSIYSRTPLGRPRT